MFGFTVPLGEEISRRCKIGGAPREDFCLVDRFQLCLLGPCSLQGS